MQEILDFVLQYKIEIALPVVVAVLVKAFNKAFPKFFKSNTVGFRLKYFLPVLLGAPLGLCLLDYPVAHQLLLGAALGGMSHFIYKLMTVALAKKIKVLDKMELKSLDIAEVRENKRMLAEQRDLSKSEPPEVA